MNEPSTSSVSSTSDVTARRARYAVCVLTFRRPESLRGVLQGLLDQVRPPSLLLVVDNDPHRTAQCVVEALRNTGGAIDVEYLATGQNSGPAGGWAAGVEHLRTDERRGDWVLVVDDDDPINDPMLMAHLVGFVEAVQDQRVAAVGLRGAQLVRSRGRLVRVEPIARSASVDYLASNGAPLYRWSAIDEVGFFDPALFFGFEDLDLGLRLRHRGWSLLVLDHPAGQLVAETSPLQTPWREYYKTRAFVAICRRRRGWWSLTVYATRSVLGGSLALLVRRRPSAAVARWIGLFDGILGNLGRRRFEPNTNPPKNSAARSE